jgi:hypothetical protein
MWLLPHILRTHNANTLSVSRGPARGPLKHGQSDAKEVRGTQEEADDMGTIYIMWAALPVLFVAAGLVIRAREDRATRRRESAVDPMFRRDRPARRIAPRSMTAGRGR